MIDLTTIRIPRSGVLVFMLIGVPAMDIGAQDGPDSRRSRRVVDLPETTISSPGGRMEFRLLSNAERLSFQVRMGETVVLEESPLRVALDGHDLSSGVVFVGAEAYEIDETYPWHGAKSHATNRCNGLVVSLRHDLTFTDYRLEVRAYNDALAYRHVIPGEEGVSQVPDEVSTFVVPSGSTVWYHGLGGHYEDDYTRKEIEEVRPGEWSGPPLTFKLPNGAGYAAITEANLVGYSGMALEADGRRGWVIGLGHRHPLNYPFELRYGREEGRRLAEPAAVDGVITTPWRVVLAGRDLNTLVNSTALPNLCPPPDPSLFPEGIQTDWVRPGRAVWRYLDGGEGGAEGVKSFSRMAGLLGFEHQVVEGFWSRWTEDELKDVMEYSRQQGVTLFFWKHSRDLRTPEARDAFFTLLNDAGVAGAKIDFFDHEAKEVVDLYETLLAEAAARRILLNFHGSNKPTGRERTWPNDVVREGVRGMESSSLRERSRHQTILPFTRYLAGAADYSAMIFTDRRRDTTWTHQIASLAVYAGPLLTVAAHPQSILDNPAVEVIKDIPAVWDETIVLPDSEIGELAAYARRTGDTWVLAVMCGPQARSLRVPLSFLDEGDYAATLVRDDPARDDAVTMEESSLSRVDSISLDLRAGGGFVGRFVRGE